MTEIRYEKVYVAVILYVDTEGNASPAAIIWEDGRRYKIDKVLSDRMSPPEHVGAILTRRYEVLIGGREKVIYLETHTNRWFVERPLY